jgi:branched-chain amino acid transport system permease protein
MEILERLTPTRPAPGGHRLRPPLPGVTPVLLLGFCIFLTIGSLQSANFAQQVVSGVATGAVYGSLALAIVLIYRATEVINLAQGEMAMFSTYVCWQLVAWGVGYWGAFLATLALSFAGGVAIERVVIRPVQRGGGLLAVVIVTVGLLLVLNGLALWIWTGESKSLRAPFTAAPLEVGGVAFSVQDLVTIGLCIGAVVVLWLFFQFTKVGLGMRASALHADSARLVGVRVGWMLALGWGLAAVLGAIAGLMTAPTILFDPGFMQPVLLYAFAAAVLGGLQSPAGAVVGGVVIGVMINLLGAYVDWIGSVLRLPVALAVLLAVLLIKPTGLFGRHVTRRV